MLLHSPEQIAFGIIVLSLLTISIYLIHGLFVELTTPNYNFHGTHDDFLAFYSAAKVTINNNVASIYDRVQITIIQRQIIPHSVGAVGYILPFNPPFVAILLAPLGLFDINTARLIWLAISIIMAAFIIFKFVEPLPTKQKLFAVGLLISTYPMYQLFIQGQLSGLVLFSACVSYLYFKKHKKFHSGASLVLLWVLPQFAVFAAIGLVLKKEWQMLKGWFTSSAALLIVTLPLTGINIYFQYIKILTTVSSNHFVDMNSTAPLTWRGSIWKLMGLNGFFERLVGPGHTQLVNILYISSSIILVCLFFWAIKKMGRKWSRKQEAMLFSAAVLLSCLINPHLYAQDVIIIYIMLPALLAIYKRAQLQVVILFAVFCNLVLLDQTTRIHLFTLTSLLLACVYTYISIKKNSSRLASSDT